MLTAQLSNPNTTPKHAQTRTHHLRSRHATPRRYRTEIENNEISIDHLAEQLKEAQAIIKQCKKRLLAVDKDINDLLTDEKTAAQ